MAADNVPQSFLSTFRGRGYNPRDYSMEQQYSLNSGNPYGYAPSNYNNVMQPPAYNPQFTPEANNRYTPPMMNAGGQWQQNGFDYQLAAGYGPYNNNGYQLPYFNRQPGNGSSFGGGSGLGGGGGGTMSGGYPADQQMQMMNPYMPNFNQLRLFGLPQFGGGGNKGFGGGQGTGGGGNFQSSQPGQQQQMPAGLQQLLAGVKLNHSRPGQQQQIPPDMLPQLSAGLQGSRPGAQQALPAGQGDSVPVDGGPQPRQGGMDRDSIYRRGSLPGFKSGFTLPEIY